MKILAIESSCDETAAAVIEDGRKILSSVVDTQIATHALYGGVVPEIASRRHMEAVVRVTEQALKELDQQAVKHVEKVKTSFSEMDDDGKPIRREVECETVNLETINSIVDRRGLQQIANSAKAIKDILSATEAENDSGSLDDLIAALREIGGGSA